jgi:hypothetical protein
MVETVAKDQTQKKDLKLLNHFGAAEFMTGGDVGGGNGAVHG